VLLKLGRTQEAVLRLTHVLDLYRWRNADYRNDKLIVRTMAECRYLSAAKQRSVNWPSVQFKDNCYVVDPLGAGDYASLSVCLLSVDKPVPNILILRPHCLQTVHEMRPVATYVARSVVGVLGIRVSSAKIAKPIEMPFKGLTYVGPWHHVLDGIEVPRGKRHKKR